MPNVVTLALPPSIDAEEDDWDVEGWYCAKRNVEEINRIIEVGKRRPLTAEQRYRLQSAITSLRSTIEVTDLSRLFLSQHEYDEQEALHLRSLGLEPLEKFAD